MSDNDELHRDCSRQQITVQMISLHFLSQCQKRIFKIYSKAVCGLDYKASKDK